MSTNLLALAKSSLAPVLASKVGGMLGLDGDTASRAAEAVVPAIVSSLAAKSSDAAGAQAVYEAVNAADSSVLGSLGNALDSDDGIQSLGTKGAQMLNQLLGDKTDEVVAQATAAAGLPQTASNGVKGMAALATPAVLGMLKQQVSEQNLDADRLGGFLAAQSQANDADSGSGILGAAVAAAGVAAATVTDTVTHVTDGVADVAGDVVDGVKDAAGAAVAVAGKAADAVGDAVGDAVDTVGEVASKAVDVVGDVASGAADTAGAVVGAAAVGAKSILSDIKWWALVALVAAAVLGLLRWCGGGSVEVPKVTAALPSAPVVTAPAPPAAPTVPFDANAALGDAKSKYLAALKALEGTGKCDAAGLAKALSLYVVNFASGSSSVKAEDATELQKAVPAMQLCAKDKVKFSIAGHTDNVGNAAANQKLSLARANAVKGLFVKAGIAADLLTTAGKGDAEPVGDNKTDAGRFANRRITYSAP